MRELPLDNRGNTGERFRAVGRGKTGGFENEKQECKETCRSRNCFCYGCYLYLTFITGTGSKGKEAHSKDKENHTLQRCSSRIWLYTVESDSEA
jgi:hypothetical protein